MQEFNVSLRQVIQLRFSRMTGETDLGKASIIVSITSHCYSANSLAALTAQEAESLPSIHRQRIQTSGLKKTELWETPAWGKVSKLKVYK